MTMPGAAHVPYLSLGERGRRDGVAVTSASKAWNLAGLKCAVIVSGVGRDARAARASGSRRMLATTPGHLGVLASIAAFDHGEEWLDALVAHLDRNRDAARGAARRAPARRSRYIPPQAGYLAWLDCRELGLGDDPAEAFLERGRVALSPGPDLRRAGPRASRG